MIPPSPRAWFFPYTTLFRSERQPAVRIEPVAVRAEAQPQVEQPLRGSVAGQGRAQRLDRAAAGRGDRFQRGAQVGRSEEHTSELQSHVNLVCRLLLEKKNRR